MPNASYTSARPAYDSEFDRAERQRTWNALSQLQNLSVGWNGNMDAPKPGALEAAGNALFIFMQRMRENGYRWITPNITADENGNVVLEWWKHTRKITLYIGDRLPIEALKVWGKDIDNQMEDITLETSDDFITLWKWLQSDR